MTALPLAPSQRGIWFLHRLAPDSSVYNVPIALRVGGPLDAAALDRALAALLHRHQALRTTFSSRGGEPVQVVHAPSAAPAVTARWAGGPGRGLAAASAEAGRRAAEPFDLANGPLWRVDVVPVGPDDHAVMLAFHHIVIDEVSAAVLARELRSAYTEPAALPAVDAGRDYAAFCRRLDGGPDPGGLRYWRQRLAEPVPPLPAERDGGGRLFSGDRVRFTVDAATAALLAGCCARRRVSPFMLFHAALAVLLHGWTGERRVAIGTPMGGRVDERFAETVGFFQNTVVLPAGIEPGAAFAAVLSASRRTVLEALPHQHTPFEAVVAAVQPARTATRNPLFQAALVYNRVKVEREWALDGLDVTPLPFDWPMSHFDVTLSLEHDAGVLAGEFAYDTNRFHRATVEDLAATFTRLLTAVLTDPDLTVDRAPHPRPLRPLTMPPPQPAPSSSSSSSVPSAPAAATDTADGGNGRWHGVLCGLFGEVLGVDGIGADDDFFELGGHSLLAGQLVSRIRSALGVDVGLRDLFEAPTVAGLSARLTASAPVGGGGPVGVRRPVRVPVSYAQRGLWYLSRLDGAGATYNVPLVLRFAGGVRRDALREALRDLVGRHESLRTVFPAVDGEPVQVVLPARDADPGLRVVQVGEAELAGRLREAAREPFDLARRIPVRGLLFALPSGEDVLLLLLHHIASDGWSLGPLGRDLGAAYQARCAGRAPGWAALPLQYADYTLWQRDRLGRLDDPDSLAGRQLAYWRDALAGLPGELALPTDRSRPAVAGYAGGTVDVDWPPELHRAVTGLARRTGTTTFMVLQAGLAALLSRLGAGSDIPIGAPTAGRADDRLADLVGYFVNTVVLRTSTAGGPTFGELVERVRQVDLGAFAHQDVPFEAVVEAVNPARSPARQPLFQVMLSVQRDVVASLALPGTATALGHTHTGVAKFDLSLNLQEFYRPDGGHAGIQGLVEYATELFDAGTAAALVARLRRLLADACADPDSRVDDLDVLLPGERHRLLVEWNATDRDVPPGTLPDRFAAQAARTPDAPAVSCGGTTLTYRQLDERTNRLARLLAERGAGPERFVAVAVPRSADLLVALLAVLKSGAAYLPVDPDQPAVRTAAVLADADPVLVLTTTATPFPGRPVLTVDTGPEAGHPAGPVTGRAAPGAAAYVLFTSGSTGRPKGVVVEHRNLALYLACAADGYPGLDGRALVPSPVTFDLTVTGLFGPLVTGGCVHLAAVDEPAPDASFLKVTPSHLPLLAARPPAFTADGTLVVGGEALTGTALRDWCRYRPQATVVNEYGPTETTVGCTRHVLRPGDPVPAGPLPIGRPLWNTRVYVLDPRGRPAPVGVPGELHVAGGLVARGYLRRPDLTAERFLADPFGPPGARMYRTGDLARWTPAGHLEYLGRLDDQLKVRGHRVEPAEIESALATHPAVHRSTVLLHDDRLTAYVATTTATKPTGAAGSAGTAGAAELMMAPGVTEAELRAHLAARLPGYLVPDVIVVLPALPLSANGKVDRAALPGLAAATTRDRPPRTPPRTLTERALHGLFAELLDRPGVGVDDDFFALGGHSLLAVRLAARIHQALHRDVPLTAVLSHPTIASLAAALDLPTTGPVRLRAGTARGDGGTLVLVHPVGGTLLCYRELVEALPDDMPIVGCERIAGTHPPEESLRELADRHAETLDAGLPPGPVTLAGWSVGGVLAHAVAAALLARGRPVAGLVLIDSLALRTPEDRATVAASAARLRHAGETPAARLDGGAELLRQYGVGEEALLGLGAGEVREVVGDWARLLELVAAHRAEAVAVPGLVLACGGNPDGLVRRIPESWAGLCAGVRVRVVAGNHLTVLRSPAVGDVAEAVRGG